MIVFRNRGEADLVALTTFGVNAKEGENPVGFFGTGFKYAVAILLRTGHRVMVQTGLRQFEFVTERAEIRGRPFDVVKIEDKLDGSRTPCGFTTEVGKNWKLWMAYRELYCNAMDEVDGEVLDVEFVEAAAGHTAVAVALPSLEDRALTEIRVSRVDDISPQDVDATIADAHRRRGEFLLIDAGRPLFAFDNVDVYQGPGTAIFYRGIKVHDLEVPARFLYNLKVAMPLTEDRTLAAEVYAHLVVRDAVLRQAPVDLLRPILRRSIVDSEKTFERRLDYHRAWMEPSADFSRVVGDMIVEGVWDVVPFAREAYEKHHARYGELSWVELSSANARRLARARRVAAKLFPDLATYPVRVARSLGRGVLGLARTGEGKIILSLEAFEQPEEHKLVGILIEEYLHQAEGLCDETRELQNRLTDLLASVLLRGRG